MATGLANFRCANNTQGSQDSSVGIATGYKLDGRDSFPGRFFFLFTTASEPALWPAQPSIQWEQGAIYLKTKRQKREADHLAPSSVEVKNDGAIHPLPHVSSWHRA
jgi:hypothetical protein